LFGQSAGSWGVCLPLRRLPGLRVYKFPIHFEPRSLWRRRSESRRCCWWLLHCSPRLPRTSCRQNMQY
jgi:hypothetical protein